MRNGRVKATLVNLDGTHAFEMFRVDPDTQLELDLVARQNGDLKKGLEQDQAKLFDLARQKTQMGGGPDMRRKSTMMVRSKTRKLGSVIGSGSSRVSDTKVSEVSSTGKTPTGKRKTAKVRQSRVTFKTGSERSDQQSYKFQESITETSRETHTVTSQSDYQQGSYRNGKLPSGIQPDEAAQQEITSVSNSG